MKNSLPTAQPAPHRADRRGAGRRLRRHRHEPALHAQDVLHERARRASTPENVLGHPLADRLGPDRRGLHQVHGDRHAGRPRRRGRDPRAAGALARRGPNKGSRQRPTWYVVVVVVGAAMLFGDGVITPAISVISAVEGIGVATVRRTAVDRADLARADRRRCSSSRCAARRRSAGCSVRRWCCGSCAIAAAGLVGDRRATRGVLWAIDPRHAIAFATHHGVGGFFVLGGVVLCDHRRRGALRRSLALRTQADRDRLVRARLAGGDAVLSRPGRARCSTTRTRFDNPFYALVAGPRSDPDGRARDGWRRSSPRRR